jgi:hypothetical protein
MHNPTTRVKDKLEKPRYVWYFAVLSCMRRAQSADARDRGQMEEEEGGVRKRKKKR